MSFSERMGLSSKKALQLNAIDKDLKNGLWNGFYFKLCSPLTRNDPASSYGFSMEFGKYVSDLYLEHFKENVDDLPNSNALAIKWIRYRFDAFTWNQTFDFIQFNVDYLNAVLPPISNIYIDECNRILKRESSAYRIIDNLIVPISNEVELKSIDDAIKNSPLQNIQIHLHASLEQLSNKTNPDYRNSIKESISAVETLCREITGENTLGKAINKFEKSGVQFNQQFKDALEKLYAYTNNKETGIRHALLETGQTPDFDEAKFMLVSCSAFVNYLISKKTLVINAEKI